MKIVIIEDEKLASDRLEKLLNNLEYDITIIDSLRSVKESINWFRSNNNVDLCLMDIQLSDGSSFEIFNHINQNFSVIFTTAYDEYAINAFKVNALDYLLKPIKEKELIKAIQKVKNAESTPVSTELLESLKPKSYIKRFLVKFGGQLKLISITDIAYFFIEDSVTMIMTNEGNRYPIDETLDSLMDQVSDDTFFRLNRQFITHIDSIDKMYTLSKAKIKVKLVPETPDDIIVSTEKSSVFKNWLSGN